MSRARSRAAKTAPGAAATPIFRGSSSWRSCESSAGEVSAARVSSLSFSPSSLNGDVDLAAVHQLAEQAAPRRADA